MTDHIKFKFPDIRLLNRRFFVAVQKTTWEKGRNPLKKHGFFCLTGESRLTSIRLPPRGSGGKPFSLDADSLGK